MIILLISCNGIDGAKRETEQYVKEDQSSWELGYVTCDGGRRGSDIDFRIIAG